MVKVLVVYYSRTGNVEVLARAVAEGVKSVKDTSVELKRAENANLEDLIACNAVAFGSPNYFGYMAGLMKDFFDRVWSWEIRNRIGGKPAAAFTCGGSSNKDALLSLERIFPAFGFKKACDGVAWGLRDNGPPSGQNLNALMKIGKALAEAATDKMAES